MARWTLVVHPDVREWLHELRKTDRVSAALVGRAIQHVVGGRGPDEGRPLVDRIKGSKLHHLKELRPASTGETEIRILFLFDTVRQMVLLVAGDKSGNWRGWYEVAIPLAEARYVEHLVALEEEVDRR
ncbi:type II toxin-antitoxin system RelE/ParE family toxin [Frankia tisae]|uniref:type II toxin-antitoxin system RelE/ParE family toxin n=1 Tax=Frankia tisae TaxID=2950104 RepID=UPI0021BF224E|nr:type II toxin-antitoxin system RelE/ParE family toxin [Frankia tisae]